MTQSSLGDKRDRGMLYICCVLVASRKRGQSNNGRMRMINNHFSTVFGALVVLTALAAPVNAAERSAAATAGVAPTGEREFGAKLQVCSICHGARGVPQN